MEENKVVLITGGARRVGRSLALYLHQQGMNLVVHYRNSQKEAEALANTCNALRADSCQLMNADLKKTDHLPALLEPALARWDRLDAVVNNASTYYSTPITHLSEAEWDDLMTVNAKAPLFLAKACLPLLKKQRGSLINILDAQQGLADYSAYCASKAALTSLTKSLAKECAPEVRINAVAPGVVLWPEGNNVLSAAAKDQLLMNLPLQRIGTPEDIAKAVHYLLTASYVTGHVLTVDGGRSL